MAPPTGSAGVTFWYSRSKKHTSGRDLGEDAKPVPEGSGTHPNVPILPNTHNGQPIQGACRVELPRRRWDPRVLLQTEHDLRWTAGSL